MQDIKLWYVLCVHIGHLKVWYLSNEKEWVLGHSLLHISHPLQNDFACQAQGVCFTA